VDDRPGFLHLLDGDLVHGCPRLVSHSVNWWDRDLMGNAVRVADDINQVS
jgi:hypothetical protein